MIVVGHMSEYAGGGGIARMFPLNQGVSFFFVLSGFILSYNYSSFTTVGATRRFFLARFARIWPSHIVCLGLFFLIVPRPLWYIPYPSPTLGTLLLANFFLVQSWIPFKQFVLSLNGVAWSISVELFFYLSFPILIRFKAAQRWHLCATALGILVFCSLIVDNNLPLGPNVEGVSAWSLLYVNPLVRLLEFQIGIVTADLFRATQAWRIRSNAAATLLEILAAAAVLLALFIAPISAAELSRTGHFGEVISVWVVNQGAFVFFAILVWAYARGEGWISRLLSRPALTFLGEISFALYLVHQIVLRRWVSLGLGLHQLDLLILWPLLITLAAAIFLCVERPARRWLIRRGTDWLERRSDLCQKVRQ
jgi:peptidoglycan/LPS O-acetylase OafA/YrhL